MIGPADVPPGGVPSGAPPTSDDGSGRVLYLITSAVSARFLRGQLGFLVAAGYDVHVGVNLDDSAATFDPGVTVHHIDVERAISIRADLRALYQTIALVRSLRPDIVNASTPKAGLLGMLAALLLRVPRRVHVVRGLRYATMSGIGRSAHRLITKLTIAAATDVVFNSASLLTTAESDRIIPPGVGRIPGGGSGNGIDTTRFESVVGPSEARRGLGLPLDVPVIGFIGRFTKDKGVADLVAAFSKVVETIPDARLVLVGDFEADDPVPDHVRNVINGSEHIVVHPWVDHPEEVYPALDVLAFPSAREGLPNVVLEAQAAGTPVVGYDAVGTVDAVTGTTKRRLVSLGDVDGLATSITEALGDDDLRAQMIDEGRQWVSTEFDQRRVWSDLLSIYRADAASDATRPPQVVHVLPFLSLGGAEYQLCRLAEDQAAEGHAVTVVCLRASDELRTRVEDAGIRVVSRAMGPIGFLGESLRTARRAGVIHAWMYHGFLMSALLRPWTSCPHVWAVRRTRPDSPGLSGMTRRVVRLAAWLSPRVADGVLYCSLAAQSAHEEYGFRAAEFSGVVYNSVDEPHIEATQPSGDPTLCGFLGRWNPDKGLDVLLQSWATVGTEHPEARLLVAGGKLTDDNAELVAMIAALDLPSAPTLVGPVADPNRFLAGLDCLVSPSRTEGFPNVIAEAMSLGVPVIATDVGGTPEVLGECGVLVEAEQPGQLAHAISSFLDDPAELRRRAAAAPAHVATKFSRARSLEETNDFYARLHADV